MNDSLLESLYAYNEHEIIYKKLHECKKEGPESYKQFLDSLDLDFVKSEFLWIPELMSDEVKKQMQNMDAPGDNIKDIRHNLPSSYAYVWKHNRYTPALLHTHQFYESIYVYRGKCHNTIDGKDEILEKGDFCIIPPNTPHSIWAEDDGILLDITLTKDLFLHTFFDSFSNIPVLSDFISYSLNNEESHNYVVIHSGDDARISGLILQIYQEYYYHRKFYSQAITGLCQYLFSLLLREYQRDMEVSVSDKKTKEKSGEIIYYIQQHFMDIDLNSTAEHFNYSPSHFSKLIKKMTGKTFITLVTEYRLSQGCRLLSTNAYSVADISDIIGYPNVEHFNRLFKKMYGKTPSQYRSAETFTL